MYICIYVYMCIYIHVNMGIKVYLYRYICLYLSISIYIYLYLSISIYICLYLSISVYICLYLSISVYIYLYLYLLSISISSLVISHYEVPHGFTSMKWVFHENQGSFHSDHMFSWQIYCRNVDLKFRSGLFGPTCM